MGVGGGMLLIPAARIFLNLEQQSAQSLNLCCFVPSALCAVFIHLKNKKIDIKTALPIIITGIPFSLSGAFISTSISSSLLSKLFGIFILVFGLKEIVFALKSTNS